MVASRFDVSIRNIGLNSNAMVLWPATTRIAGVSTADEFGTALIDHDSAAIALDHLWLAIDHC